MNESDVLICPPVRGYAEERQYATTIFRAQDGTETRENDYQSGEDGPIRVVDFPLSPISASMAALIDNTLAYAAEGSLLVPLWFSLATATQAVSGSRVYCDTRYGEFAAAEQVLVLTADLSAWEYRTIDAVADTYVDVTEAFTGATFAAGAIVVPIIEVFPQGETQTSFVLDARRSVNYRVEELVGMAKMSGMFTPSTYSGYPIFDFAPSGSAREGIACAVEVAGEAWGKRETYAQEVPERALDWSMIIQTQSDRRRLIEFFDGRNGRLSPFWVRSRKADLILSAGASSGASKVQIQKNGESDGLASVTRHVYARPTGSMHKITDLDEYSGYYELTLSPVLSDDLGVGSRLENFLFCRFDIDALRLELSDLAAGVVETKVRMRELQRETP